jgi:hypothetical protein
MQIATVAGPAAGAAVTAAATPATGVSCCMALLYQL